MRNTIVAALAAVILAGAAAPALAGDGASPVRGYPRVPASTVDQEHYDWPYPANFAYRQEYGNIGGYGFPPNLTGDHQFVGYTPFFGYSSRYASGEAVTGARRVLYRMHRHRRGRVAYAYVTGRGRGDARPPLHYIVPDYVGHTSLAPDGASYRSVRKGRYVNEYERKASR